MTPSHSYDRDPGQFEVPASPAVVAGVIDDYLLRLPVEPTGSAGIGPHWQDSGDYYQLQGLRTAFHPHLPMFWIVGQRCRFGLVDGTGKPEWTAADAELGVLEFLELGPGRWRVTVYQGGGAWPAELALLDGVITMVRQVYRVPETTETPADPDTDTDTGEPGAPAWEAIPEGAERQMVRLWHEGRSADEIGRKLRREGKTVLNRLSDLRRCYGESVVPRRRP